MLQDLTIDIYDGVLMGNVVDALYKGVTLNIWLRILHFPRGASPSILPEFFTVSYLTCNVVDSSDPV
jgi:hypothetical protein